MRKWNKMVSGCNSVATKTSNGTLPLPLRSSSKTFQPTPHIKPMTVSQNGRYVKLQIMGWIGIWHVPPFVLKYFCNPSLHMSHQSAKISFPVQTGVGA